MKPNLSTDHRPWPIPRRPWVMAMSWHDLLFMHWPVKPALLRDHVPAELALDTFDGEAWLGVVPFVMRGVRPRFVPPIPGISVFPELNLRTYVVAEGKAGVWFVSLDAASRLAVRGARRLFHLPYFDARMRVEKRGRFVDYRSQRIHRNAPPASFGATYGSAGNTTGDDLERWLTERYCLYAATPDGRLLRGEIHHRPWPLEKGEAEVHELRMTAAIGIENLSTKPLLHFAPQLDVVAWLPVPVGPHSNHT